MIIRASCGTGSRFDCTRRQAPDSQRATADSDDSSRALVPVRHILESTPPRLTSHKPSAAFLAQLADQYSSRENRADARRQRLDTAVSAYARGDEQPARTGTERNIRV